MSFCPNCGAQATGSFCPNCGTPLGASGSASSAATPVGSTTQGGVSDNVAGALCYTPFFIGIICSIVFLVVAPYNRNRLVRFHAFQSLLLHLAFIVLSVVLSILVGILAVMTHGVAMLLYVFHPILWIGSIVLVLVMMYQAYNGQRTKLPIIGDIADKQA